MGNRTLWTDAPASCLADGSSTYTSQEVSASSRTSHRALLSSFLVLVFSLPRSCFLEPPLRQTTSPNLYRRLWFQGPLTDSAFHHLAPLSPDMTCDPCSRPCLTSVGPEAPGWTGLVGPGCRSSLRTGMVSIPVKSGRLSVTRYI